MDKDGFREFLKTRKLDDEKIDASIALAERFEKYMLDSGGITDAEITQKFCALLVQEGKNSYDNFLALARYGRFIKNNGIYVAMLESLDGAEAQPNLFHRVGEMFGEGIRDEVFAGIGISQLGVPSSEKPFDMFPVIDRLVGKIGYDQVELLLSSCLRDLPDEYFKDERQEYIKSGGIDAYLEKSHQSFLNRLENCQKNHELFFSQEITDEVVSFVRNNQEIECGVREGNVLFVSKIPYNAKQYLIETDPLMKRYYACHCPWAREAIKNGNITLNPVFCNCSAGFSKKPWEIIFGQTLEVEVLESAIKGDSRCRFAIHLPENLEIGGE